MVKTLRLSYYSYVDIEVPDFVAGVIHSGQIPYWNKWGEICVEFKGTAMKFKGAEPFTDIKRADGEEWIDGDANVEADHIEDMGAVCCGCNKLMGGKLFKDEAEFNKQAEAEGLYIDDEWFCFDCRDDLTEGDIDE